MAGVRRASLVAVLCAAALWPVGARAADGACSRPMPAGSWANYGGDQEGTQRQRAEARISAGNAGSLAPAWITENLGYQSIPIVAGGCVFATGNGAVHAFDLATGRRVWTSEEVDTTGAFAVAVAAGRVHVNYPSGDGARAAALDADTGDLLWESRKIGFGYKANQLASAVVHEGVHVLFTAGPDYDPQARPGYALLDAATGQVLKALTTIPAKELDAGYAGGGVWGTPTVDSRTGYLYAATANPYSKRKEHAYDTAVLKLDLRRGRPTFGRILGSYKGSPETVLPYDSPVCQALGENYVKGPGFYEGSVPCTQLDVDFGNGPSIFRDARGRTVAAILQKSGDLHLIDTATMKRIWVRNVGTHAFLTVTGGNISRAATDGRTVYVNANPAQLWAIDAVTGATRWRTTMVGGMGLEGANIALANGVLYAVGQLGVLAFDARDGRKLWQGPNMVANAQASGVAVAGNRVVATCNGTLCTYRLPG